jgi:hypothetical protein
MLLPKASKVTRGRYIYELTISKEDDGEPDGQRPVMDGKSRGIEGKEQPRSISLNNMDLLCGIRKSQTELQV